MRSVPKDVLRLWALFALAGLPLGLTISACDGDSSGTGGSTSTGGTTSTGGSTSTGGTTGGGGVTGGGGATTGGGGGTAGTGGMTGGSGGSLTPVEQRGQYLVDKVVYCSQCHTPYDAAGLPDNTLYLAGNPNYVFPYMGSDVTLYAHNLTNSDLHGMASWSDDQIETAIVTGIDDEGAALWPHMPYPAYAHLTPDDATAMVAYLRKVVANEHAGMEASLANPEPETPKLDDAQIPHTTLPAGDPDYQSAEKGRYLAIVACLTCHTPESAPGVPDLSKAFAGGKSIRRVGDSVTYTSTNITPDATGIAGWSALDIGQAVKTNTEKSSARKLCPPMPGGPGRMGDMEQADLLDIGRYLSTIPPIQNGPFKCDPNQ